MCSDFAWAELVSPDWTYLWVLDYSKYNTNSIGNPYWNYGNKYNAKSIFNQYWNYWSRYSDTSPWNQYATKPPLIKKWGVVMWTLTLNRYANWAQNTFDILWECFLELSDDRRAPFEWLNPWWSATTYAVPWTTAWWLSYSLTEEESCQLQFWLNATVWDPWYCKCKNWYKWNSSNTSCIALTEEESCQLQFWLNATSWGSWKCKCKDWYMRSKDGTYCEKMTEDEICQLQYWDYSYSPKDGYCRCKDWYEWDTTGTKCIKSQDVTTYTVDNTTKNTTTTANSSNNGYYTSKSDELKDAIQWMYDNWLTMWNTLPEFLPYDNITREQASKFFVEFAAKVLWKDRWVVYNYDMFSDIKNANPTLKDYIIYANNMWLFKGSRWKFMPFNNLTKAQAITVLIRLVDWMQDESWTIPYMDVNWDFSVHYWWYTQYLWHVTFYKIDKRGITSNIDKLDSDNINRWDLAILLYEMAMYLSNPDNIRL